MIFTITAYDQSALNKRNPCDNICCTPIKLRAREIADFDAEDPVSRVYLLLSYLIEAQRNIHDGIPKD